MHTSYMFGPAFVLRNFNYDGAEIGIAGKGQAIVNGFNLTQYVSFEQNDRGGMIQVNNTKVTVVGHVHYWGYRTDVPPFDLDIEEVSAKSVESSLKVQHSNPFIFESRVLDDPLWKDNPGTAESVFLNSVSP